MFSLNQIQNLTINMYAIIKQNLVSLSLKSSTKFDSFQLKAILSQLENKSVEHKVYYHIKTIVFVFFVCVYGSNIILYNPIKYTKHDLFLPEEFFLDCWSKVSYNYFFHYCFFQRNDRFWNNGYLWLILTSSLSRLIHYKRQ